MRDEFRTDFDADRGGYGRVISQRLAAQQLAMWQEVQAGASMGAGMLPGSSTIFFGQGQRLQQGLADQVEQQQQQQDPAGAEEAGAVDDQQDEAAQVMSNPRLRGRGMAEEEEEDDFEQQVGVMVRCSQVHWMQGKYGSGHRRCKLCCEATSVQTPHHIMYRSITCSLVCNLLNMAERD